MFILNILFSKFVLLRVLRKQRVKPLLNQPNHPGAVDGAEDGVAVDIMECITHFITECTVDVVASTLCGDLKPRIGVVVETNQKKERK
jgi:hypothetical protein